MIYMPALFGKCNICIYSFLQTTENSREAKILSYYFHITGSILKVFQSNLFINIVQ